MSERQHQTEGTESIQQGGATEQEQAEVQEQPLNTTDRSDNSNVVDDGEDAA